MTIPNEELCLNILDKFCKENFEQDEYSLYGQKESAVCIERTDDGWLVYESEKNSRNNLFMFDNIIEAGLDFLKRMCSAEDYKNIKHAFFDRLVEKPLQKINIP